MSSIKDDRGFNQGFELVKSTQIRMQRRADYMISIMDPAIEKSILEIGCGTGEVSFWIAKKTGKKVLGTDLCVPFIEDARKKFSLANLNYDVLDFNKAGQFKGEKFDYILGNGILHHLYYQLDEAFLNMRKLLKESGKIIFLEPNIYNPYIASIFSIKSLRKLAHLEPDEMAFSKNFVTEKLGAAGYKDIRVEYKDFLLPGVPEFMIYPSIEAGNILEKIPLIKMISQSIYISATI